MKSVIPQLTPDFIIELAIRRRWMIMLPLSLALAVGIYMAIILPRVYEAKTLILVESQRVPQNYVQSIVTTDTAERINTISQQITSRTNLEKIIRDFHLFGSPEEQKMFMEDKIGSLRKRISVNVIRDARRETEAFTIAYKDTNPQKVMQVANGLASYFINENLKAREGQAIGTSEFLDDELEAMRLKLEQVEENIKDYRKANMGELPEQLETNLQILGRYQEDLSTRQQSLRESKIRLAELNNQNNREPSVVVIGGNQNVQTGAATLEDLQAQLETLQTRYTERHPDIQRLKAQIADLQAKAQAEPETGETASKPTRLPPELRRQIAEVKLEIHLTETEIEDLRNQIEIYKKRIENIPRREQELLGLKRDYENIQATYDSLLQRKLEADIAVNMERKQKGEQFRIVDPAREPQRPIEPNMKKLFAMVIAAGLGLGGGLALILEIVKPTFRQAAEIETEYEIPVLTTIPKLLQPRQIFLNRLEVAGSVTYALFIFGLLAAFSAITITGFEPVIEAARRLIGS